MTSNQQEWVAGFVKWGGTSQYQYKNHNYSKCGQAKFTTMCGNNYFVNTPLGGGTMKYSVCDRQLGEETCVGVGGCPSNGCCLDYTVCPNIGQIQSQVQWSAWNNGKSGANLTTSDSVGYAVKTPEIACLYPLATFQDLQSVLQFKSSFPTNPSDPKDAYTYQILPQFCLTQTTECPENPATGVKMKNCSRFVSTNLNDPCKGYLASLVDLDSKDSGSRADQALLQYCSVYNTPDCDCINRFVNPAYQVMSVGQNVQNDACWWKPCQDVPDAPTTYLVPKALPTCQVDNVQICNNVNIVVGGNSSGLTFNPTSYTSCTLTENPYVGPGGGGTETSSSNFWSYWWILLIAVIVIVIVIILLIVL